MLWSEDTPVLDCPARHSHKNLQRTIISRTPHAVSKTCKERPRSRAPHAAKPGLARYDPRSLLHMRTPAAGQRSPQLKTTVFAVNRPGSVPDLVPDRRPPREPTRSWEPRDRIVKETETGPDLRSIANDWPQAPQNRLGQARATTQSPGKPCACKNADRAANQLGRSYPTTRLHSDFYAVPSRHNNALKTTMRRSAANQPRGCLHPEMLLCVLPRNLCPRPRLLRRW